MGKSLLGATTEAYGRRTVGVEPRSLAARVETPSRVIHHRSTLWLAWAFWAVCLILSVYIFGATTPSRFRQLQDLATLQRAGLASFGLQPQSLPPLMLAVDTAHFLVYLLVGLLIFARKPREPMVHFASIALITLGLTSARRIDSLFFVDPWLHLPILTINAIGSWSILLFIYLFPDGRFAPRWVKWLALLTTAFMAGLFGAQAIALSTAHWPPPSSDSLIIPPLTIALSTLAYRYRHVLTPSQQQQAKWVATGGVIAALAFVMDFVIHATLVPDLAQPTRQGAVFLLFGAPLHYAAMDMLPLSIGISILFYKLWDIDLLIERTLLFGMMTALMAGVFGAVITLAQRILLALTGQQSDLAAFFAAVVVIGIFTPVRDSVKAYLDNRGKFGSRERVRLKGLVAEVNRRVSPLDPYQVARRLTEEAVEAYRAKGGAAFYEDEGQLSMFYHSKEWEGEPCLTVAIRTPPNSSPLAVISLAQKVSGKAYSAQEERLLEETAEELASAIEQDREDLRAYDVTAEDHASE